MVPRMLIQPKTARPECWDRLAIHSNPIITFHIKWLEIGKRFREYNYVDEWNIEIVYFWYGLVFRREHLFRKRQAQMKNENQWEKERKGFSFLQSTSRKYISNNLTHQPENSKE